MLERKVEVKEHGIKDIEKAKAELESKLLAY